ncbi:DUF6643 family protein [Streptomyces sp. NPDC051567]|uniref:DUF6643 family protein n=1 Tax=Streptomyces sp. NPDC051567 TaxID=3365660 RepID=UPI0037B6606F
MTSPRSTYGGGYYSAPSFSDTPIYDSLVAERGTPQIAPIRVPAAYESPSAGYASGGYLPALPAARPALPPAPPHHQQQQQHQHQHQHAPAYGYPYQQQQPAPQPMPLPHAPVPYVPQQQPLPAHAGPAGYLPQPVHQPPRPVTTAAGYESMRPAAAPRPAQAPVAVPTAPYEDPYGRPYQGRGY